MGEQVELRLEPSSERFDALDDRWLDQVTTLVTELDREVGGIEQRRRPVQGGKGAEIASIIVSLGSAGVFAAAVDVVRSWLVRDRTRSLKVSWSEDGALREVEVRGGDLDGSSLDDIVRSVTERLAGAS